MTTKDEDAIADIKYLETHDNLLFFTNKGKVYQTKAYEIGESSRTSKGTAIVNLLNIEAGEKVESFINYRKGSEAKYVFLTTKKGTVKKSALTEFENIRKSGILAIKLDKDDELVWSKLTKGDDDILLVTRNGKSIRFNGKYVRPMGRNTMGVRGILIGKDDRVIQMDVVDKTSKQDVLTIMENGLGKKTPVEQFKSQGRGGQGVKVAEVTAKTGKVASSQIVATSAKEVIITSQKGQIVKLEINSIPKLSRATQGVILMRFSNENDHVASSTCIEEIA
jgi:DNA gyrase subunit A